MVPFINNIKESTAIFFYKQDVLSIIKAVELMEKIHKEFDPAFITKNALRFEEKCFISNIKNYVYDKIKAKSLSLV